MNSNDPTAIEKAQERSVPTHRAGRLFRTMAAVALIAVVLSGFHSFCFQGRAHPGRELTPPIRGMIIMRGIAMPAWMLVFLAQPLLILVGNRRAHAWVGTIASFIAAAIVILGIKLGVESARFKPPGSSGSGVSPCRMPLHGRAALAGPAGRVRVRPAMSTGG